MTMHPARRGTILFQSDTHTADVYDFGHYRGSTPAIEQDTDAIANQVTRLVTLRSQETLSRIREYELNWDGYGSLKPSSEAIANAEARLPELYRLSKVQGVWREPHVSASEAGEISFEWWSGPRKVTMYFSDDAIEIMRVWGVNMDTEMELQLMPKLDSFPAVWSWLYGN